MLMAVMTVIRETETEWGGGVERVMKGGGGEIVIVRIMMDGVREGVRE